MADIDWRAGQNVPYPSIEMLLKAHLLERTFKPLEGHCHALARILSQPLPQSWETGFRRLIVASQRVTLECAIPGADFEAEAELQALGFELCGSRWIADTEDAAAAMALEMRLIALAAGNQFYTWRIDAVTRYGPCTWRPQRP